MHYFY